MAFEPRSPTFAKYGGEHQPLLDFKQKHETVVGIAGSLEIPDEAEPHVVEELKTLLKLVYPVVVTSALEFLPGVTCIILAGHIQSPRTQQYVDAATLHHDDPPIRSQHSLHFNCSPPEARATHAQAVRLVAGTQSSRQRSATTTACTVSLLLTLGISLTFAIALYVFRGSIPSLFLNDPKSIARAASVLAVWAPLEVLHGLNAVVQGIFQGAGKQKVAATVNAVAYYIFGIPVAGLLSFHFMLGVEGLWLGFGLGVPVAASLQFYMLFGRWTWVKLAEEAQMRTAE